MKNKFAKFPLSRNLSIEYYVTIIIGISLITVTISNAYIAYFTLGRAPFLIGLIQTGRFILVQEVLLILVLVLLNRGNLFGLLCWPAVLFFIAYFNLVEVLKLPINLHLLPNIPLVPLCIIPAISIIMSIDPNAIENYSFCEINEKLVGGLFLVFANFSIIRLIQMILYTHLPHMVGTDSGSLSLWTTDILLLTPLWFLVGFILLLRKPMGYFFAPGVLLLSILRFVGILPNNNYNLFYPQSFFTEFRFYAFYFLPVITSLILLINYFKHFRRVDQ